jgi:spindle assembly checkpoint component MAD3
MHRSTSNSNSNSGGCGGGSENSIQVSDWETCKENVLPVKAGRSVAHINSALNTSTSGGFLSQEKERQATMSTFDRQIDSFLNRDEASRDNSELLNVFTSYFKYARTEYPSSQDKALKVLERCTLLLKDDDAMRNDCRFVKLWIEYADMVPTPNDVFSFMNSNKIGSQMALFWIAWVS